MEGTAIFHGRPLTITDMNFTSYFIVFLVGYLYHSSA